ncbi:MAG: (deoxy)nucleoside triphosphate pyrophosphohydrolase [Spirochaetota bacterium]
MDEQAIVVTAGLIERDGRYLVARKPPGGPRGGMWEFPGGKVEPGETDRAALARELGEELGVVVSVGRPADVVRWSYPDVSIELRAYECTLVRGEPAPGEHDVVRWVRPEELLALPLCEADVPIARRIATAARRRS